MPLTNVVLLQELIDKLKRSSKFSPGDQGSFKVFFDKGLELPGKDNPSDYLKSLNIKSLGKTAVLFAGNGGLCVELCKIATSVTAYEPRLQYEIALREVDNINQLCSGNKFENSKVWPEGLFETVIWTEGLDTLKSPMVTLSSVYDLLEDGGTLFVEVTCGEQISTGGNSWKPTEKVFANLITKHFPNALVSTQKGRLQRRIIYKISKPQVIKREEKLPEIPVEIACSVIDFKEVAENLSSKIRKVDESKLEENVETEIVASDTENLTEESNHKFKKRGKK